MSVLWVRTTQFTFCVKFILCYLRTPFPPVLCFCTWIASCFLLYFLHSCFKCCYFFFHFVKPPLTQFSSSDSSLFLFFRNSLYESKQLSAQCFLNISSQQSCLWLLKFIDWRVLNGQFQFLSIRPTGKVDKVDVSAACHATWSTTCFFFVLLTHWPAENNSRG